MNKLKRSLNISFLDDPYLAVLMKRMYLKNIKGEVDELNIQINGINEEMIGFIKKLWDEEALKVITRKGKSETISHGEALNELYSISDGDIFIIMDSDNFVYQKGIINRYCSMIEETNGFFDFVGNKGPYMAFFRKSMLDKLDVDFREEHKNGKFHDTMKNLLAQISEISAKIIPIDNLPEWEHIGRMSAFGIYVEQCYLDIDTGLNRNVRKLFGRSQRVALIKYIYNITKKDVPFPGYNECYLKTFLDVCDDVGHKQVNIDKIIEETTKSKLKDYDQS